MDPDTNQKVQHEQGGERQREREAAAERVESGERPWEEQAGVMSVVAAVRDLEFPKSIEELRDEAGDREVIVGKDARYPLAQVLGKLREDRFESVKDFQTAVQRHWEGVQFMRVPEDQRPAEGGANPADPATRG